MLHLVLNHRRAEFVALLHERAYPVRILETAPCDDFGLNDEGAFRQCDSCLQIAQSPGEQHQPDDADVGAALLGNLDRCPVENAHTNKAQALRKIEPLSL